jgi:hypothetical protein
MIEHEIALRFRQRLLSERGEKIRVEVLANRRLQLLQHDFWNV